MLDRCYNPNNPEYARYGGSGIRFCEAWNSFEGFLADMGERPAGTSLDRFPNGQGNYEPGNCRWATPHEQNVNRKVTKLTETSVEEIHKLHKDGVANCEIAARFGVSASHVSRILGGYKWKPSTERS